MDSTLSDLLSNETAKQILEKHAPGITTHPMLGFVKGMTLRALMTIPQVAQSGITPEKVEVVLQEINSLKTS